MMWPYQYLGLSEYNLRLQKPNVMHKKHAARIYLYNNGLSLSEIAKTEKQISGVKPNHSTILSSISRVHWDEVRRQLGNLCAGK